MDGYFVCDDLAVTIHDLRDLICQSRSHARIVFLCSADDILSDLLETGDRAWTTMGQVADGLEN